MLCSVKLFSIIPVLGIALVTYTVQQENDPEFIKESDAMSAECAQKYGLTADYVNNIWNLKEFPKDNNLKCYFSCLALKSGTMDETGAVIEDVLEKVCAEYYNVTLAEKMGDICDIAKDGDLCQTAYDMMQCILNLQNGQSG